MTLQETKKKLMRLNRLVYLLEDRHHGKASGDVENPSLIKEVNEIINTVNGSSFVRSTENLWSKYKNAVLMFDMICEDIGIENQFINTLAFDFIVNDPFGN